MQSVHPFEPCVPKAKKRYPGPRTPRPPDDTPIDLVIANAGVSEETLGAARDVAAATRGVFDINVTGVFNTVLPLLPRMKARGAGQIAIMSSLAGSAGMPGAVAYSASKVAVRSWGEGLRGLLYRDGVFVNVICPGFVRSPMTSHVPESHMPMLWDLNPAVDLMVAALARDEPVLQFPGLFHAFVWALAVGLPPGLKHAMGRCGLLPGFLGYLPCRRKGRTAAA